MSPIATGSPNAKTGTLSHSLELMRQERRICGYHDDDRISLVRGGLLDRHLITPNPRPHGNAGDLKVFTSPIIGLHQHPQGVTPGQQARGRPNTSLETMANHAGATSYIPLFHPSCMSLIQSCKDMLSTNMVTVNVIEATIPGFGHHRKRSPSLTGILRMIAPLASPLNGGLIDRSHAVRVGQQHGLLQKSRLVDPGGPGHFAIAIELFTGSPHGAVGSSARKNRRHPCPHSNGTMVTLPLFGDQGAVPHPHSFHIRNRITGTRSPLKDHSPIPGAFGMQRASQEH